MANIIYGKAKEAILEGLIDITSDQIKVLIVDSNYSLNQNLDQFISNIPSNAIKYRSQNLVNITNTLGVVDADDIIISNYPGYPFNALILYKDTGNDNTSSLIAYIDDSPRNTIYWYI